MEEKIASFVDSLNKKFTEYKFSSEAGRKNTRIVREAHGQRSVYCFIENETGNILKAAGWKAPAKGVRGNLLTVDMHKLDQYGGCFYRR